MIANPRPRRRKPTERQVGINQGFLYAAADLTRYIYDRGDAADLLRRAGLSDADCAWMDEVDKEQLRILRDDYGLRDLRGLD
ncbi:hypothetical protein [Pseudomonas abietaniphila]|uniref:Uncharacterized protein n=1 Tax=Pseudomonas abietaniphila TaxID=89065 RepID=A0A1G8RRI1_9PSED|nr:hypothetical protein [Pseudomonas abietaniphila]SDJ19577.1 hypothetical protein SAMN05216605_12333 [Pseudomonas abietaniphila]